MPNIVLIQIIQYDGSIVDLTVKFSLYSTKQLLHFNIQFSKANISFDIRQSMTRVLVYHRLININHIPVFYYPNFYNYDIDQWTKNVIKQKKKKKLVLEIHFPLLLYSLEQVLPHLCDRKCRFQTDS